jgi:hypothetical protein
MTITTPTGSTRSTRGVRTTAARAPWTLHLAAIPLTLMALVTCVGAVYFGTHPDPTRPAGAPEPGSWQAWSLILILLAYAVTAIGTVPGMYRRSRTSWGVALAFIGAHVLFGSLKFFGLGEDAALTFLALDAVVAAGLLSRRTRNYVRAG